MSRVSSKSGNEVALVGMRGAVAMFDIMDPDNFEFTVAGRSAKQNSSNDWTALHECVNSPGVLVGIVPMAADLTAQWEEYDKPLPTVDPGPFDAASKLANLSHGSTDMNLACEAYRTQGTTEKKKIRNTKEQTQRISICIFAITVRVRERLLRRYSL